jgi:hypothetical protein
MHPIVLEFVFAEFNQYMNALGWSVHLLSHLTLSQKRRKKNKKKKKEVTLTLGLIAVDAKIFSTGRATY